MQRVKVWRRREPVELEAAQKTGLPGSRLAVVVKGELLAAELVVICGVSRSPFFEPA
jgi:hypothetical protein